MNNLVNYNYNFMGEILPFKNCKLAKAYANGVVANVTTDLYTCPVAKKAFIVSGIISQNNDSVQATGGILSIKNSGNYYVHVTNLNEALAASRTVRGFNSTIYLDENEGLAITINQTVNCWFQVYEFDKSTNIKISRVLSFVNGNNTIYTCPANTIAIPATIGSPNNVGNSNLPAGVLSSFCNTPVGYANGGALSVTASISTVPSGQAAANWISQPSSTFATNTTRGPWQTNSFSYSGTAILTAGDSIVVNVNSTQSGQHAWAYFYEIPA